jgi:hypothetical protein
LRRPPLLSGEQRLLGLLYELTGRPGRVFGGMVELHSVLERYGCTEKGERTMRTRWMLLASVLVLMLLPGALRAADAPGCAPTAAVAAVGTANVTASAPAPAATVLPVWVGLPAQSSSPQTLQEIDGTPLFLTTCSGCVGTACTRLHSCVLLHCC